MQGTCYEIIHLISALCSVTLCISVSMQCPLWNTLFQFLTVKTIPACPSKSLLNFYQTTRRHMSEDLNLDTHCYEDLKSHITTLIQVLSPLIHFLELAMSN